MRILPLIAAPLVLLATAAGSPDRTDPVQMKATVEKLVSFGTRHTASDTVSDTRGIGAARRWAANRLNAISDDCGGCIEVANVARGFTGPRAPNGVQIVDVLGFQRGQDTHRVVIVMGHIDSRVSDVMDATSDAPGANDDGSGVAVVLEAARILSKEKFKATIVYAITSGEEQGLWGAELLAQTAKSRGWTVIGVLNNDIVGGTTGADGSRVADRVRLFYGADDGPGRALADGIVAAARTLPDALEVRAINRDDRVGRGGDQMPFMRLGYPAVRFTAGIENLNQQHQNVRVEGGIAYGDTPDKMDFDYLAKVAAINVAAIRQLANGDDAPKPAGDARP